MGNHNTFSFLLWQQMQDTKEKVPNKKLIFYYFPHIIHVIESPNALFLS